MLILRWAGVKTFLEWRFGALKLLWTSNESRVSKSYESCGHIALEMFQLQLRHLLLKKSPDLGGVIGISLVGV